MAFIQIIQIKGGQAGCSDYWFKDGTAEGISKILPGEMAYVPDEKLESHLASGLVASVDGRTAKGKVVNPEDMPAAKSKETAA